MARSAGACPPRSLDLRENCSSGAPAPERIKSRCSCPTEIHRRRALKRFFHGCNRGGQAPALRYARPSPFHRRARACPSPCPDLGNGLGWRAFFAQIERSRGTGPRATVCKAVSLHRRARACPSPCLGRNGKRRWLACVFRAGREIAGDRPPRYGPGKGFSSPCARSGSGDPELRSSSPILLIL